MKWPVATIGEICEVVSGATPKTGKPEFWDGNILWVTPKDLSKLGEKYLSDTPRHITEAGLNSCSARMLPAQSVLFSSRAPIGLVAINTLPVCTNQGFKSLVPCFDLVSPDFLFWWLKNQKRYIQSKGRGATFKEISKKIVEDLKIPLPPLPEQRRIAEILDKADALRAKRRAALAKLDILTQSIFLEMFGDPVTNPKKWPVVTIADICEVKGGKRLPKGEEYSSTSTPHRYIRVVDLKAGRVEEENLVFLKPEIQAKIAHYVVNFGDIIISIAGSIGLVAPVPATLNGVNLTENAAKLVPRRGNEFDAVFLAASLQTPYAQSQIRSHIGQVTIGKLALFRIEKIKVPLPELALQREFVLLISALQDHDTVLRRAQLELDALFASLQHRAFRGEL